MSKIEINIYNIITILQGLIIFYVYTNPNIETSGPINKTTIIGITIKVEIIPLTIKTNTQTNLLKQTIPAQQIARTITKIKSTLFKISIDFKQIFKLGIGKRKFSTIQIIIKKETETAIYFQIPKNKNEIKKGIQKYFELLSPNMEIKEIALKKTKTEVTIEAKLKEKNMLYAIYDANLLNNNFNTLEEILRIYIAAKIKEKTIETSAFFKKFNEIKTKNDCNCETYFELIRLEKNNEQANLSKNVIYSKNNITIKGTKTFAEKINKSLTYNDYLQTEKTNNNNIRITTETIHKDFVNLIKYLNNYAFLKNENK